jgi:hypothetical protein
MLEVQVKLVKGTVQSGELRTVSKDSGVPERTPELRKGLRSGVAVATGPMVVKCDRYSIDRVTKN